MARQGSGRAVDATRARQGPGTLSAEEPVLQRGVYDPADEEIHPGVQDDAMARTTGAESVCIAGVALPSLGPIALELGLDSLSLVPQFRAQSFESYSVGVARGDAFCSSYRIGAYHDDGPDAARIAALIARGRVQVV